MLNESRLLSFLSKDQKISLNFFEGQKLIQELAFTHSVKQNGFAHFRDIILSTQPLIALLKHNESFGIYIDSELPYFRFKIEMSRHGEMRTLLLPENFNENPSQVTGICRLAKTSPGQATPYTSIIGLNNTKLEELPNLILDQSYQIQSVVHISDESDQSILLMKLPTEDGDETNVAEKWKDIKQDILSIFANAHNDDSKIIEQVEAIGFTYLSGIDVSFKCNCSTDRMLAGIRSLASGDLDNVFKEEDNIEVTCDYCHKIYNITRAMLSH